MPTQVDVALSVDALSPKLTGIGRYCLELARGLPGAQGVGEVSYFRGPDWWSNPDVLLAKGGDRIRKRRLHRWLDDRYHRLRQRNAIVHGPNYFIPDWADGGLITVHDLSIFLYPDTHPLERVLEFERKFKRSLDRATAIITDSIAVREEVIEFLGIAPERVFAVPLGADSVTITADHPKSSLMADCGLIAGCYTLCLSTFEPRKRIDRLIDAYEAMPVALRERFPLVLAGASGWHNESLNARILEAQSAGWLKRLEFVSDTERDRLYAGARLFVYPSIYEGFGLPPIEAMKHGVPTIISDAVTLMEVTKGAARVVDPEDIAAFSLSLAEALEDETWQAKARIEGKAVADGYRWVDCVANTVAAYQAVASGVIVP